tara:strand:+ start:254 stop:466 length:213 start_codon:yes stop_codon:yes gene_type:complete
MMFAKELREKIQVETKSPPQLFHRLGQLFVQELNGMLDGGVLIHHILNSLAGVNDGTMITASECIPYFLE